MRTIHSDQTIMRLANRVLLAVLLLIAVGVGITACTTASGVQTPGRMSLYDRVMNSGKIRCAYVVYAPGCLKDPNTGKLNGIGPEVLERAAHNLGLQVEWTEEVGWGSMIEGLQTGRYDMIGVPIWANSNRARVVDFSKPLYFSPVCAYARPNDKRFSKNFDAINSENIRIAIIDGESAQVIARNDFPKAKQVSLPQLSDLSQLLLTISSGKADVTFQEPCSATPFVKNNPGAIANVAPDRPVRVFPNEFMFGRGEVEFKAMLDTAIDELMNSGYVEKVLKKYEAFPNALYRVALPYQPIKVSTK